MSIIAEALKKVEQQNLEAQGAGGVPPEAPPAPGVVPPRPPKGANGPQVVLWVLTGMAVIMLGAVAAVVVISRDREAPPAAGGPSAVQAPGRASTAAPVAPAAPLPAIPAPEVEERVEPAAPVTPVAEPGPAAGARAETATEELPVLSGIVSSGAMRFARIDGQLVRNGDRIAGYVVESISQDVVVLVRAGRRSYLRIKH